MTTASPRPRRRTPEPPTGFRYVADLLDPEDERSLIGLLEEPRSAYVIGGDARSMWQHSIPPTEALRYSITYRTVRARHRADC